MKRLKRRYFAGLLVFAGILITIPAFANPPFPHKSHSTHQAANDFEQGAPAPTYYLFGQSGYGGFGRLYIPANGDKQGLSDPATPTLTRQAGGSLTAGIYSYRVSALNADGQETLAGPARAIAISATQAATQRSVKVSWAEVSGAASYRVYGRTGGSEQFIASVAAVTGQTSYSYTDDGLVTPNGAPPTLNATLPRLDPGSFVEANCLHPTGGYKFRAHVDLAGLAINNPAGLINATAPATKTNPSDAPGNLGNPRFSIRWFPSVASAPTGGTGSPGGFPTGPPGPGATPPGGGQGPAPAEIGTASISGTNNPSNPQVQTDYCTFRENLFVEGRATLTVVNIVIPNSGLGGDGTFDLIVKDASGAEVRRRPAAGNGGTTDDGCQNPPTPDEPLCAWPNRPAGPGEGGRPASAQNQNGDNWPRIAPASYDVSATAAGLTNPADYTSQTQCNDIATDNGFTHATSFGSPVGTPLTVAVPAGANVHIVCLIKHFRKQAVVNP
jgi:hypothetical protein